LAVRPVAAGGSTRRRSHDNTREEEKENREERRRPTDGLAHLLAVFRRRVALVLQKAETRRSQPNGPIRKVAPDQQRSKAPLKKEKGKKKSREAKHRCPNKQRG
jgi:hypothetical protein